MFIGHGFLPPHHQAGVSAEFLGWRLFALEAMVVGLDSSI
jgi:hypothetical protein